jgi:cytochrome c nitrite reductase small subunit
MSEPTTTVPRPARRLFGVPLPIALILIGMVGAIFGLGTFTFIYAKGASYLSDEASACANCHVMREVYDAWNKGSHKAVATCNDCHTSHANIIAKYASKAINGLNHSLAFTLGNFPEPIRITQMNRDVTQQNCLYCHSNIVSMMGQLGNKEPTDCLRCHANVGHSNIGHDQ